MNIRVEMMKIAEAIQSMSPELGGTFSYSDLSNIIAGKSAVKNSRTIRRLINAKILIKVQRGIYTVEKFDLEILATRIENASYISMDSLLARAGIIATLPARKLTCVYTKARNRRVSTGAGDIVFHSISKNLFFGFERLQNGVQIASPEKAWLDMLYFYMKGQRFVIDPLKEANLAKLDKKKIMEYLKKYKNAKFVKFVEGLL